MGLSGRGFNIWQQGILLLNVFSVLEGTYYDFNVHIGHS